MHNSCSKNSRALVLLAGWGSATLGILIPAILFAQSPSDLQERIRVKEAEVKKLEVEADAYRTSINQALARATTLKGEISRIDSQLKQLSYNLSITGKKIEATELAIEELRLGIADTNLLIKDRLSDIGVTLQQISEFDRETLLATFFKSEKISDYFVHVSYLESLQLGLKASVDALRGLRMRLENDLSKSEIEKAKFNQLKASLAGQKRVASDKKTERSQILAETKNQEQNYQKLLAETEKKQTEIEKEIFELEQELRRQINSAQLPPRQQGLFAWPLDGGYVTQEFGPPRRGSVTLHFYSFHNGIDFGAKTGIGTPVRAVMNGTVAATGDNGRYAYGKWATVEHSNGLVTLYAHMSYIAVRPGMAIKQGDLVGHMGRSGLATGPHLHLTVYAANTYRVETRWFGPLPLGGAINPRDYLPRQ